MSRRTSSKSGSSQRLARGDERAPTRKLTVFAQDPGFRANGKIVTARVVVPAEELSPGPWGHRVHVIDYDTTTDTLYKPRSTSLGGDPYANADPEGLVANPQFHHQNVYAIVMSTLARFEFALGRRVSWGFLGHQIKVAPHAFATANAFYSDRDEALLFGYFPGRSGARVFSCLSHDVVAHETSHALVDGLRKWYVYPSSPDQAAFHEGFADVVALLSVFALEEVVHTALELMDRDARGKGLIKKKALTLENLRASALLAVAEQMGQEMRVVRGDALRRSVKLKPEEVDLDADEFMECHRRGEVFVAAMMNAFLKVWTGRLESLGTVDNGMVDVARVAEEGAAAAERLLTAAIRALDYAPPVDLEFPDYLSALLTGDAEVHPGRDSDRYEYRQKLLESFAEYKIKPASPGEAEEGVWRRPDKIPSYDRVHFERMQRDPDEVFRFLWENRELLGLHEGAYTRVVSVRPCTRLSVDGFTLRETVAECIQTVSVRAKDLRTLGLRAPNGMSDDYEVHVYGGAALIFDEFGRLKFNIHNKISGVERQQKRLDHLWQEGALKDARPARAGGNRGRRFAQLHMGRFVEQDSPTEGW